MLRTFGNLGALVAVLSTFVAWYSFEVAFAVPAVQFSVPVSLWSLYPGASALLTLAAIGGAALVNVPALASSRRAGAALALLGLAIAVYSAVRILDVPSLAVVDVPRPAGYGTLKEATNLDGGPFLSLAGGFLLALGALPMLLAAGERERGFAGPRPAVGGPSV
jgi:hypothetical protein